ncbi:hypothetical protein L7F22_021372 [Adiantum nelumboides]|nr:hypothetical protein [Adiantum nelumboides]
MDPAKVEAIKSWPDLKMVHDVRSFLGLCSYYRRFIRNFVEIASPLNALRKKGVTFRWTQKEISAFNLLKEKMTSDLVIVLPDLRKSFVVQCDACGSSIGAVLMQDGRVVAYESRILQGPEKTMQVYEKELSALIHALLSWKHYLLGADLVVQTDHQTLRYFLTQAKLSEKHMRWANILSMFHFQVMHVEGKKNVVADVLSRKPQISAVSIPYHHELDDMREQYANDEDFARIFEQLMDGHRHEQYLLKDCFMMMHGRLCVTRPLQRKVMEESHVPPYATHRGIDASVKAVETFFYWRALRRDVDAFLTVAGYTAGERAKMLPKSQLVATLSLIVGCVGTLAAMLTVKAFPATPRFIIPTAGYVIGNSMSMVGGTLNRLYNDIRLNKGQIEAALALGASPYQSVHHHVESSIAQGMGPMVDAVKTAGLISLPGSMTGMLMGGSSPMEAVQMQMQVLYMVLGCAAVSCTISSFLGWQTMFSKTQQLLVE